jgi:DNA-binding response OmpR family regulator
MVHISRIRSRIEDDPQKPKYLKTIRGIGYKLHYLGEKP